MFKTSCTPEAQKQFERALAMLHSFYFPETIKAFTAIPKTDPSCAIAYWGIADHPAESARRPCDAATLKRGLDAVEKGDAIGAEDRARARLAARDHGVLQGLRQGRPGHAHAQLRKAMEALRRSIRRRRGEDLPRARAERDVRPQEHGAAAEGDRILEPLDKKYRPSRHHALPDPQLRLRADRAEGRAGGEQVREDRAAAPHAQHMPSHIYSMVGMWKESIARTSSR
jgi:hypothetical protein